MKKDRIFSFLLTMLMLIAAAITVNKAVFGHNIQETQSAEENSPASGDPVTVGPYDSVIIHTAELPGAINGYAGPVPLDIHLTDGKISEIKALSNADSPSFFQRASALFDSWIGMTPEQALDMKVDAVSGATYSSAAIINNINAGLAYYQGAANTSTNTTP